ncbi:Lipid A biosynthesis lauroyltransferase [Andreprevotia sp. IGB-42]|uniref:lysophospholipid acyltransferase family protein n=1 Tax=Andreprevotia sp. IGB-42 TaxID=2497473 RepID=UPI00157F34F0|nr:lipid A biosynthesis lauroyl acyltransferase [Andreprevotia sp. IGB-42]KAF0814722.1 Lipid A biosynthesis lauroyltransferase [Andreprevotia sp. IGB-42]
MNQTFFPATAPGLAARLLALPFRLLALLPFPLLHVLGGGLGSMLYLLLGRRRHIGLVNLRLCFPEWRDTRHRQVLRQHFRQLATCIFAYGHVWFAGRERFKALVRHEGYEHYAAAVASGRPVILLVPHFLGLDAGGIRLSVDHHGCSMYSASHENAFDQLLLAGRSRFGSTLLIRRNDGIRAIIKALREPRSFYYLPDQDLGPRESIFVPFFGVPTATVPALGKLAKLAGAVVVPMVTTLDKNGFVSRFYPCWEDFPAGDEVADTARMNAFIEACVREHPSQYYWLHRRFKTRPEGMPGVY